MVTADSDPNVRPLQAVIAYVFQSHITQKPAASCVSPFTTVVSTCLNTHRPRISSSFQHVFNFQLRPKHRGGSAASTASRAFGEYGTRLALCFQPNRRLQERGFRGEWAGRMAAVDFRAVLQRIGVLYHFKLKNGNWQFQSERTCSETGGFANGLGMI